MGRLSVRRTASPPGCAGNAVDGLLRSHHTTYLLRSICHTMNMMNSDGFDRKLNALAQRYEELQGIMADPHTASDPAALQRYGREYASITDVVEKYRALQDVRAQLSDTEAMLGDGLDEEMRALAYEEIEELHAREAELTTEVQVALLP